MGFSRKKSVPPMLRITEFQGVTVSENDGLTQKTIKFQEVSYFVSAKTLNSMGYKTKNRKNPRGYTWNLEIPGGQKFLLKIYFLNVRGTNFFWKSLFEFIQLFFSWLNWGFLGLWLKNGCNFKFWQNEIFQISWNFSKA